MAGKTNDPEPEAHIIIDEIVSRLLNWEPDREALEKLEKELDSRLGKINEMKSILKHYLTFQTNTNLDNDIELEIPSQRAGRTWREYVEEELRPLTERWGKEIARHRARGLIIEFLNESNINPKMVENAITLLDERSKKLETQLETLRVCLTTLETDAVEWMDYTD